MIAQVSFFALTWKLEYILSFSQCISALDILLLLLTVRYRLRC
jgi:hypothetical protein